MTDYKHGDWYCKPANDEEAKEIFDRAIASGAECDEIPGDPSVSMEFSWNCCDYWGVLNGKTYTGSPKGSFKKGKEYTIDELRQKFPLPCEQAGATNNSGYAKQQYPIGTPVEVRMNGIWHTAMVNGQAGDYIIARADGYWYDEYVAEDVRHIRNERDRWVEAAAKIMWDADTVGNVSATEAAKILYDAIQSGQLKTPTNEPG